MDLQVALLPRFAFGPTAAQMETPIVCRCEIAAVEAQHAWYQTLFPHDFEDHLN